ncbi:hypothetical protein AB0M39_38250 [Streptomyces sp. NPDC051907]|uniref:hypothetical protein n=1 Tax=Streptomyces sp. NPDC051907 TaxID=3155284 RepID=UPI00341757A4
MTDEELEERLAQVTSAAKSPHGVVHPLPHGDRVWHSGQRWAATVPGGTAVVVDSEPQRDGSWEYDVLACRDFSRRPGPGNPMDRPTRWPGWALRMSCDFVERVLGGAIHADEEEGTV